MARRTWDQALKEELPKLQGMLAEATDDIRHKVIEQAWSGQEQTGSIADVYGQTVTQEHGHNPHELDQSDDMQRDDELER